MNVSQFAPDERMRNEAVGELDALGSVSEVLHRAGEASPRQGAGRFQPAREQIVDSGSFEGGGIRFDYAVDALGRAIIVRCLTDAERIAVPAEVCGHSVSIIGHHAFSTCYSLVEIDLPACITEIREHAFMNTALREFVSPDELRFLGERAFFGCGQLVQLKLGAKVRSIGAGAFRGTALEHLAIPASVSHIGHDAFKETGLVRGGLVIDAGNGCFTLDGGALYRFDDAGLVLEQLLDDGRTEFASVPATVAVAEKAFAGKSKLVSVTLGEGVISVGEAAFKGCSSLVEIALPDSLERMGRQAFWGTALTRLHIPAGLREAGTAAFYTGDSVPRRFVPTICEVTVAEGNEHFYIEEDALCQRLADGNCIALLYFGNGPEAVVPASVSKVGPYAYLNRANVRQLTIFDTLQAVDVAALDFGRAVPKVIYRTTGPDARSYVVEYPPGEVGRQTMCLTFGLGRFDIDVAYAECDSAILSAADPYTRYRMMADRLANPVCMTALMADKFRRKLSRHVPEAVVAFGRNGYVQGVGQLFDLGILTADNVQVAIDAAVAAGEVAVSSALIQLQRTAFGRPLFDFDL